MSMNVIYKNGTIVDIDDSLLADGAVVNKTLLTSGKYCEDDFSITYRKTASGGAVPESFANVNFGGDNNV